MTKLALMDDCIPYSPTLGAIFGCCGALLIQQVHYWCKLNERDGKNFRDGYYWTYNTYKQWEDSFKDWEERTIRRNISELLMAKVLILGRYNKVKYDKTNWYRVDYFVLSEVTEKYRLDKMTSPSGQNDQSDTVKMSVPIPKSTEENTTKITLASQEPDPQTTTEGEVMLPKIKPVPKGPTSSSAILAKACGNKVPSLSDTKSSGMYKIWAKTAPEFNSSVTFVKPFTQKQYGQMNQLVSAWGTDTAGNVLHYVLSNWVRFGKFVKTQVGLKMYPESPSTDFLAKYSGEAMNFFMTKAEAKDSAINCTDLPVTVATVTKVGKITIKKAPYVEEPVQTLVELSKDTTSPTPALVTEEEEDDGKPMTLAELLAFKPLVK